MNLDDLLREMEEAIGLQCGPTVLLHPDYFMKVPTFNLLRIIAALRKRTKALERIEDLDVPDNDCEGPGCECYRVAREALQDD
jgi:hypothetical protein